MSRRPSWPLSLSLEHERQAELRRFDVAQEMRDDSFDETLSASSTKGQHVENAGVLKAQELLDLALQETGLSLSAIGQDEWPEGVLVAVQEVREIALSDASMDGGKARTVAEQLSSLGTLLVEYLDPLVGAIMYVCERKESVAKASADEEPWYFGQGVPSHVMRWESTSALIESRFRKKLDREWTAKWVLHAVLMAAYDLVNVQNLASDPDKEDQVDVIGYAQRFVDAWQKVHRL